jgi:HD-GYP domain-containing protein (c-di-GMP phosphodiesterase class II)
MDQKGYFDKLSQVVSQLTAAVTNVSLYPPTHPRVAPYIDRTHASLTEMLEITPQVMIMLIDDELVSSNRKIVLPGSAAQVFVKLLKKKGVESISFITGLPRSHLEGLIQGLASPDAKALLSTSCIKLGKVEVAGGAGGGDGEDDEQDAGLRKKTLDEEISEFIDYREHGLSSMSDMYNAIKQGERMDIKVIHSIVGEFVRRFRREMNPLSLLGQIKNHDEYTFVHVTNVALLVMCQAEALGFSGANLHDIGVAALLHDVGKLVIPDNIVAKPASLTIEEREVMEQHATLGAQYLMSQKDIPSLSLLAALEHHIKFDGTGYPSIPGRWRPHIVCQLITIGDVFDAMRSRRPYRDAMPMPEIVKIMRASSGTLFNPMLADFFLRLIER